MTPAVLDTLVMLNNTVEPGNFPALLGLSPAAVTYDPGTQEVFSANLGSDTVTVVDCTTNTPITNIEVGSGPVGLAYDGGVGDVYVANQYSNNVSVISDSNDTVVATIPVGYSPYGVAYDPALGEIIVTNGGSDNLSIISDSTDQVIASVAVGSTPQGLAFDSARNAVFVANENSWNMSVMSMTNNTVVANFLVNTNVSLGVYSLPIAAAYDPVHSEIFVADYATNNVTILNDTTYAEIATPAAGIAPAALAYDNATDEMYVANQYSRSLTVIDDSTNLVTFTVPVGQSPVGVVYDSAAASIYVANSAGNLLSVVTPSTHTVSAHILLADTPGAVAYDSGAGELFVANGALGTVSVVSDTSDQVVATIGVGADPSALAYDSALGEIFVANLGSNNVSVITDANDSVVASVGVGFFPGTLAFDAGKGEVYVANFYAGSVSVISAANNSIVTTILVGGAPDGVAYDSGTGEIFVANLFGNVSVINDTTNSVILSIGVGSYPDSVVYAPSGQIYVANYFSSNVTVIDDSSNAAVANTNVGLYPSAMAYDRGDIVVANYLSDNVSFLSGSNYSVLASVAVGNGPQGVAFDSGNSLVYVANVNQGTVSILWGPSPPTSIASFTPTPAAISLGSPARFLVTATGGTGNYTFQYAGLPAGCTSMDTHLLTCTPTVTGIYTVKVYVNDTTGTGPESRASAEATLSVNPHSSITSLSAAPPTLSLGSATTLRVNATGGTGALFYFYTGLPPGCGTLNTPSLACLPSAAGTYRIVVAVTDSTGSSVNATVTIVVNPHASIGAFTANPVALDVYGATNISVDATGGTGTLSYVYTGLPTGCTSQDRATLECRPTGAGTSVVKVFVNDSTGSGTSATLSIVVNPAPSVTIVSASPALVNLGSSTSIQVTASGGTGGLLFEYTGLPLGCATINAASLGCTPAGVGTFDIHVFANDTAGVTATGNVTLTVDPALVTVGVIASATTVAVGGQLSLTASPNCAGGPCPGGSTYVWSLGRTLGTLNATTGATVTYSAGGTTGPNTISVVATLNGIISPKGSVAIAVAASVGPALAAISLNVGGAELAPGGVQTFNATAVCGGGPCPSNLTFAWVLSGTLGSLRYSIGVIDRFQRGCHAGNSLPERHVGAGWDQQDRHRHNYHRGAGAAEPVRDLCHGR